MLILQNIGAVIPKSDIAEWKTSIFKEPMILTVWIDRTKLTETRTIMHLDLNVKEKGVIAPSLQSVYSLFLWGEHEIAAVARY